jgi:methionine biosynthesis protein MetW
MLRADLFAIERWITPNSQVLDLGCGDGALMDYLQQHKQVKGYGLEIDAYNIERCIQRGVNVIEQNLDEGLNNFSQDQFDTVIMTQALQAVKNPKLLLQEMMRIAQRGIITFPNFAYWRIRWQLLFKGRMPISKSLPYHWYDTPNIHLCTFNDFEDLCRQLNLRVLNRRVVDNRYQRDGLNRLWPNFWGEIALYHVSR